MRKYILLVEDSADDEELMLLALAQPMEGVDRCDVVVVRDGQQALDFLTASGEYRNRDRNNLPALVLLDLNLPKMGGIELLRRVRNERHLCPLPVVVMTTSDHPSDLRKAHSAGVNSYIVKPVDFERFVDTVSVIREYWLRLNVV